MIALYQGPDHTIVFANKLFLQATGKTTAIFGRTIRAVFPELTEQGIFERMDAVYERGEPVVDRAKHITLTAPDSLGEAYVDISYQPYRDADSAISGVLTHAVSVSDQVLARQRLQDSEERFRTLIQQSTDAIQLITPEGEVLYSSDSVVHILGYTPEEILGVNVSPYIHPDDAPGFAAQLGPLLQKPRQHIQLQYRARHKNGEWVWLETTLTNHLQTPNINALVGNFRDITARKQTEEALQSSEARLRRLVEANVIGIIFWHIEGGITYANDLFLEMVGYTRRDLAAGRVDWVAMTPSEWAAVDTNAVRQLNEFGYHPPVEKEYFRKDGTRVNVVVGSAFFDATRKEGVGFVLDITAQKRTARQRDLLKQTAEDLEAQRLQLIELNQAKDEFISLASHQLRTPASAVKQYLGLVLEGYVGPVEAKQRHMLEVANSSNNRQIKIIDNLLRVAKADAGKISPEFAPCDMGDLLAGVVEEQLPMFAERNQTLTFDADQGSAVTAVVDSRLIRMALENMIDNASKYTPPGKGVAVTVTGDRTTITITIADKGVGIAKKDLPALFKKFSRIHNSLSDAVGGTGLGLYWVEKVIDLHRGTVTVQSRKGSGTTFTITLPKQQAAVEQDYSTK
jgi:PAS domain S-box-containing protein